MAIELFPSLDYRMSEPNLTFKIFTTGKGTMVKGKTEKDVLIGFTKIKEIIKKSAFSFKK